MILSAALNLYRAFERINWKPKLQPSEDCSARAGRETGSRLIRAESGSKTVERKTCSEIAEKVKFNEFHWVKSAFRFFSDPLPVDGSGGICFPKMQRKHLASHFRSPRASGALGCLRGQRAAIQKLLATEKAPNEWRVNLRNRGYWPDTEILIKF